MRLLHISDLHFRSQYKTCENEFSYGAFFHRMTPPLELLDRCLLLLQDDPRPIDAVMVSGDLTEDSTAEDYCLLRKELERRFPGIPLAVTLGNHDDKAAFYEGWLGQEPVNEPRHHIVRIGSTSLLVLDSSRQGKFNGIIDSACCRWLRQAAAKEEGRTLLLMTHHHLLADQAAFSACQPDPAFPALLRELGISAVFCGHTHHAYQGTYAGIPYRTSTSMSFYGTDSAEHVCMRQAGGFSLYTLEDGVITEERHEALDPNIILGYVRF